MSKLYSDSHRRLQREFDTERLADRIEQRLLSDQLDADDRLFIEGVDMFFLATADAAGRPSCSYKGGDPGFVRIIDERTLVFPSYDGNGMYLSMGNALENAHVGLLFIDFESQRRLRVSGVARIEPAASVDPPYPGAQFVVKVEIREVFPNCSRYIHERQLVARSKYVPNAQGPAPAADWKRKDWACDVLPAGDPALTEDGEGA
jgi:predicted pyridoxine 5'-phosphate oxidase superfamily flavin-nucleotide-binding protein